MSSLDLASFQLIHGVESHSEVLSMFPNDTVLDITEDSNGLSGKKMVTLMLGGFER